MARQEKGEELEVLKYSLHASAVTGLKSRRRGPAWSWPRLSTTSPADTAARSRDSRLQSQPSWPFGVREAASRSEL